MTGTEIVNHSFVESETYATGPCSDFMQVDSVPSPIAKPFQRSPICTSYVNWYKDNVCSAGPSVDSPVKLPPGVYNEHLWNSYECCGGCNILDPPHVSILYWPPDTTSECFNSGASTQTQAPRPVSLDPQSNSGGVTATGGETIAVLDGMTL